MYTNYGVIAKSDSEIAVSEKFILSFQKFPDCLSARLYKNNDKLGELIAVCEHDLTKKITSYAFVNNKNENIFSNTKLRYSHLGDNIVWNDETFF